MQYNMAAHQVKVARQTFVSGECCEMSAASCEKRRLVKRVGSQQCAVGARDKCVRYLGNLLLPFGLGSWLWSQYIIHHRLET